jgi:lipopolysaccharide transport system permease protein
VTIINADEADATSRALAAREAPHIHIAPPSGRWNVNFRELWAFRDLYGILVLRDIKLRYKQTVLGVLWVILQPLLSSLIFAIIFGSLAKLKSDGAPYILFVFTGMLPWNLFAQSLQRAGNSMVSDSRLIQKIYFPRLIIPVASASAVLIDFAVAGSVLAVLLLAYGFTPLATWLAVAPLTALALLIAIGTSLTFSALNVYYRDFSYALPFVVQTWMYASPLVYATSLVPDEWRILYYVNPMAGVIDGFRWALLGGREFPATGLAMAALGALVITAFGMYVFQRVERNFADVI